MHLSLLPLIYKVLFPVKYLSSNVSPEPNRLAPYVPSFAFYLPTSLIRLPFGSIFTKLHPSPWHRCSASRLLYSQVSIILHPCTSPATRSEKRHGLFRVRLGSWRHLLVSTDRMRCSYIPGFYWGCGCQSVPSLSRASGRIHWQVSCCASAL